MGPQRGRYVANENVVKKEPRVWSFQRDKQGRWTWAVSIGDEIVETSEPFVQYWDCVHDAKSKGYAGDAGAAAQSG